MTLTYFITSSVFKLTVT